MPAQVVAVHRCAEHRFSKDTVPAIELLAGHGVRGDAHCGVTVKHCSRVARDPTKPNLRQVHLIHEELFDELRGAGFAVAPGQMGENITTRGIDLLALSAGTRLRLGRRCVVEVTGLRNPCAQIEQFESGLLAAVLGRDAEGGLIRKTGVMGIVLAGGGVAPGDAVAIEQRPATHLALQPV